MNYTISNIHCGKFESRGSRFLSFLTPFSRFDTFLLELRENHRKAVHFVYATRIQEAQVIESFSDDGEPRGSSGIPTLNVLRGENLIDVGLITVRYFGGTLLGVGGLVRAYTQSAQEAIKQMKVNQDFFPYQSRIQYSLALPYRFFTQAEYFLQQFDIEVLQKEFNANEIRLLLSSTKESKSEFEKVCKARFGLY